MIKQEFNRVLGIDYNLQSKTVSGLEKFGIISHMNQKMIKIIFQMVYG